MFKKFSILIMLLFILSCNEQQEFNSMVWKNWVESEVEPNTRWLMKDDLLHKHDLKNYSKEKIIELLGEPDSNINNEFWYFLGYTNKGINTGTLIIKFKNNSVIEVKIAQG